MNADDLDYRARTFTGCIPPALVSRLIELGHADEVRSQAGRGEWFCAREWARLLAAEDRQTEALAVLAPYVATGWWQAARTTADLLESWARIDEAIALLHTRSTTSINSRDQLADLLARHRRGPAWPPTRRSDQSLRARSGAAVAVVLRTRWPRAPLRPTVR